MTVTSTNGNGAHPDAVASFTQLEELNRQVERGSLFTQATLQKGFERIEGTEQLLGAVIRALTLKGVVSAEELGVTIEELDPEEASAAIEDAAILDPTPPNIRWPSIAVRVEGEDEDEPAVQVDCAARMHICQAVCCRLKFPLSAAEVEQGNIKWDIGHPYIIRQDANGWCTHNADGTRGCEIYDERPGVCRKYSCYGDGRIWSDFDNMVLNHEWLDNNLGGDDMHISAATPPSMEAMIVQKPF
jgi:Fe-S-cluster containining protein